MDMAPRLLDLVRQIALTHFGQDGPGDCYSECTRRLILFYDICSKCGEKYFGPVAAQLQHAAVYNSLRASS
jgi:hypothetical protein